MRGDFMKKTLSLFLMAIMVNVASMGHAGAPDVSEIIAKMNMVHNSAHAMAQQIEIIIKSNDEVVSRLLAGKARKKLSTGNHMMMVILEPEELKGFSFLFQEKDDMTVDSWIYPPAIARLRKLTSPWNAYEHFLNTDFTYADLGFVNMKGEHTLLGQENIGDMPTFKVQTIPQSDLRIYSKIITWVSKESYLPLRRDFYDVANRLFKQELFEDIILVADTPVPKKITMKNIQMNSSTQLLVKAVKTDLEIADYIFKPERLKYASTCPVWARVCLPSERKVR
jgi:outer membrane lipoprotein-sorting protein